MFQPKAKVYHSLLLHRKAKVYSPLHAYAFWITFPLFGIVAVLIWIFAPVA